jgi:hypothetical protein
MRNLLNKPWFVAVLALAALAFVVQSLRPQRNAGRTDGVAAANPAEVALPELSPAVDNPATAQAGDEVTVLTSGVAQRDPFAPSAKSAAVLAAIEKARPDLLDTVHLSAIWTQNGATYILLNGSIHLPGDAIGRLKIETASTDGVWLTHWKGRDHLELGDDFTLRTPASNPVVVTSSL